MRGVDVDSFVGLYRDEWRRLETATAGGPSALRGRAGPDLDDTIRRYLRVSAHLAEARARYPDPQLIQYLTGIVARAHTAIYGTRARSFAEVVRELGPTYRKAVRSTAPFIWISTAIFLAVACLSLVWVATSPEARAGLLPPEAREAIRSFGGEPADFGIGPGAISTAILINNIQVAFLGFAFGITLGVGTLYVLVLNALNLGVLAGAFTAGGKAAPFWALILPHGLLELTAIFIACGAGLRIGWAIVEPGDRRRGRALAETAREAVIVVAGVIPAFIVAGFVEGYVSGSPLPAWAEVGIGVVLWIAYCAFLLVPGQRRPNALARRYSSARATARSPGGLSTTDAPS